MGTCNCSNISRGSNISQRLVNNLTICAVSRLMAKCGVVVCFRQFCCSGSSNKSAKKFHAPRLHPVPKSCSFCRWCWSSWRPQNIFFFNLLKLSCIVVLRCVCAAVFEVEGKKSGRMPERMPQSAPKNRLNSSPAYVLAYSSSLMRAL